MLRRGLVRLLSPLARRIADGIIVSRCNDLRDEIRDFERRVKELESKLHVEEEENKLLWQLHERSVAFIDGQTSVFERSMTDMATRLAPKGQR